MLTKDELKNKYKSANDLIERINQVKGNTFAHFDINNRLANKKNKGALGQIVEEGIFGYPINSDPSADFDYLGLELKTTGVVQNNNKTISAKERLPLDNINYFKVVNQSFIESDMWIKSKGLFLVLYKFLYGRDYGEMPILKGIIHRFSVQDLEIIMQDYNTIVSKVKEGKANYISEGDTMYLGACTAGKDSDDLVDQPYSFEKAKKRKFCLKQSYMTQIIRENLNYSELEHIFTYSEIQNNLFEMAINMRLKPFFGKSESQLQKEFGITTNNKSRFERYIAKMLGIKGKVNDTDEFVKANMELKTIRIEENGRIIESMSFPSFNYIDIASKSWEESDFRDALESKKFVFAIFEKAGGEYKFKKVIFWNMPIDILDSKCKEVYEKTSEIIRTGNIVKNITINSKGQQIRKTNFPGMSFNGVLHVRPHGLNSEDVDILPIEEKTLKTREYTKHCFWLNNSFIKKVVDEKI